MTAEAAWGLTARDDQRGRDGRQGRLDASIAGREGHILGMEARARRHRSRRRSCAGREGRGGQRQKDQRGELHLCKNDGLFSSLPVEQRAGNDTRTGTQWQQATAATNHAVKEQGRNPVDVRVVFRNSP